MKDNPSNLNRIRLAQAATGISPADFPLGSMQSRAAARALADHSKRWKPGRSQYDCDALQIVQYARMFLCGSDQLKATAIYKRGEQLEREPSEYGEVSPWDENSDDHLAEHVQGMLQTMGAPFQLPSKNSKCRKPAAELLGHYMGLLIFRESWERQLAEMPFPLRVESGDPIYNARMFRLEPSGEWNEYTHSYMILGPAKELKDLLQQEQINA
jgi:hypothetical protein